MQAEKVFEILIREHSAMLLTYLRAVIGAPSAVDDIFQETLLTAWQKLDSFDHNLPFGPWLRGIAKNHAYSHFRKVKKDMLLCNESVFEFLDLQLKHIEQINGESWQEKTESLHLCIEKLPDIYRQAIHLRYIEERKTSDVQAYIDITKENLKKRLQRAKSSLFKCLQHKNILLNDT